MTTVLQNKLELVQLYFSEALRLKNLNGITDDYDICRSLGDSFEPIANLKLPILSFLDQVVYSYHPRSVIIDDKCVKLLDMDGSCIFTFSFLLTSILSFSGNVGIREIEYDGGFKKHIEYLSLFFPLSSNQLYTVNPTYGNCDEEFLHEYYINFYKQVSIILSSNPMSLYSLLTGIKKHYNLLDNCVFLETAGYSLIDFTRLKNPNFINNFSDVEIENSDTSPMLKISYQGNKLLHLRTKVEKKNSSFKLRFFIETSSKFLTIFKKEE